jgi:hypothetical protein
MREVGSTSRSERKLGQRRLDRDSSPPTGAAHRRAGARIASNRWATATSSLQHRRVRQIYALQRRTEEDLPVSEVDVGKTASRYDVDQLADLDNQQAVSGFERLTLPRVLEAVQRTGLPIPIQNPALLPLYQLDPEVLERLAAEVVSRRDNVGTHFYGRRGQKQHGLDIVEFERDSNTSLYQVKRYETLLATQMGDIVEEYAGPPRPVNYEGPKRRFDPHRFVIVTSAPVESDTGNIDGLKDLRDAYRGDLTIEVWGAEALVRQPPIPS